MIPRTGAPSCGVPVTYNGRGNGGGGSGRRKEEEMSGLQASGGGHGVSPFPRGFTCNPNYWYSGAGRRFHQLVARRRGRTVRGSDEWQQPILYGIRNRAYIRIQ